MNSTNLGHNGARDFVRNPKDLSIADLLPNRPTVGNDTSVVLWRLVRLVGMYDILGEETETISYFTGKKIGRMLEAKDAGELCRKLTDMKIGTLTVSTDVPGLVQVSIKECLTCSGITPPLGRPICQLEVGIVAGALERMYADKKVSGIETKCIGGLGDDVCLVECRIL